MADPSLEAAARALLDTRRWINNQRATVGRLELVALHDALAAVDAARARTTNPPETSTGLVVDAAARAREGEPEWEATYDAERDVWAAWRDDGPPPADCPLIGGFRSERDAQLACNVLNRRTMRRAAPPEVRTSNPNQGGTEG